MSTDADQGKNKGSNYLKCSSEQREACQFTIDFIQGTIKNESFQKYIFISEELRADSEFSKPRCVKAQKDLKERQSIFTFVTCSNDIQNLLTQIH